MSRMSRFEFCERFVFLGRKQISFRDRPYLPAIYASKRNLVLRCSRQTEKSTFLANTILHEAVTKPGIEILFVSPRIEQARSFSKIRLAPRLRQSPFIRQILLGHDSPRIPVMNLEFSNGSMVFLRGVPFGRHMPRA